MALAVMSVRRPWWRGRRGVRGVGSGGSLAEASWRRQLGVGGGSCRHRCRAAAVHRCGGDEDTCGDSDGGATDNNQQSTKSSSSNGNGNGNDDSDNNNDENKGKGGGSSGSYSTALAAAAAQWGQQGQWRQRGGSAAVAVAGAVWWQRQRGSGGSSSAGGSTEVVGVFVCVHRTDYL